MQTLHIFPGGTKTLRWRMDTAACTAGCAHHHKIVYVKPVQGQHSKKGEPDMGMGG